MKNLDKSAVLITFVLIVSTIGVVASPMNEAEDVSVAGGETLRLGAGGLLVDGDLLVDGEVVSETGDLVLHVSGDLVVTGTLRAAHGAAGERGGSVQILASSVRLADTARIVAGAGGHGEPSIAGIGHHAYGQDGGDGGSVIIDATATVIEGDVLVGLGGRGGDAFGSVAVGGDGGDMGAFLLNGVFQSAKDVVPHDDAPMIVVPLHNQCHITQLAAVEVASAGSVGQDGGHAYACGTNGGPGAPGLFGLHDTRSSGDKQPCELTAITTADHATYHNLQNKFKNGMNGGPGYPGTEVGGLAKATGGAGGASSVDHVPAGDGGAARADGGNGGAGGQGGAGGFGKRINGCNGGNGGNGMNGGNSEATGGTPGIHATDCTKHGAPGTADSNPGAGGAAGAGGARGDVYEKGDPWYVTSSKSSRNPGNNGYSGTAGSAGLNLGSTVFSSLPCFVPGAPTLYGGISTHPSSVRFYIKEPVGVNQAPITDYFVTRTGPDGTDTDTTGYVSPMQPYHDDGLEPETTYQYVVKGLTDIGDTPLSATLSITTMAEVLPREATVTATPQLPDNDIELYMMEIGGGYTDASDDVPMGHSGPFDDFEVHVQVDSIGTPCAVNDMVHLVDVPAVPISGAGSVFGSTTGFSEATYLHEDLWSNMQYCYAVRGVRTNPDTGATLRGPFSEIALVVLPGTGLEAPGLVATSLGGVDAELTITDPLGGTIPDNFLVYRHGPILMTATCPPPPFIEIANVTRDPITTQHIDTGLNSFSKYCYVVVGQDSAGNLSPPSGVASVETGLGMMTHPSNGLTVAATPGPRSNEVDVHVAYRPTEGRAMATMIELSRSSMDDGQCLKDPKLVQTYWRFYLDRTEAAEPAAYDVRDLPPSATKQQASASVDTAYDPTKEGATVARAESGVGEVDNDPNVCYFATASPFGADGPTIGSNVAEIAPVGGPRSACAYTASVRQCQQVGVLDDVDAATGPVGAQPKDASVNEEGGCGGDARAANECDTMVYLQPEFDIVPDVCEPKTRLVCDFTGVIEVTVTWGTGSMTAEYHYKEGQLGRPSVVSDGELPKSGEPGRVEVMAHSDEGHYDIRIVTAN